MVYFRAQWDVVKKMQGNGLLSSQCRGNYILMDRRKWSSVAMYKHENNV